MQEALIALAGVLVGGLVQWFVSRSQFKSEKERLLIQLQSEWTQQNHLAWQAQFQSAVAELIGIADPETNAKVRKELVVPLIHKVQLSLNIDLPSHNKCNAALNAYALALNGWSGHEGLGPLLGTQSAFFEAARQCLWLPGRR